MLDLITKTRLTSDDFHQRIEFLIDGFIARQLITMFYAEGGSGKSWLAYAVAKYSAQMGMDVIYLDYDNPITVLADRGLADKLINPHDNLFYMSSSKSDLTSNQMIDLILDTSADANMSNTVLLIDSLRDFVEVRNDFQSMQFMDKLKAIRKRGATIIVLSHSNKDARNYEGSNNIYNSLDNMFRLSKIEQLDDGIKYLFTSRKDRAGTGDCAFELDTRTLGLSRMDVEAAQLTTEDKEFIDAVTAVLTDKPGINKKELLEAIGCDKRDHTANGRLERYEGKYWVSVKRKNVYTYSLQLD